MFKNIRDDFKIHGRSLANRAIWAMVVYRYGVWSLKIRFRPLRFLASKVYGGLQLLCEILTGACIGRTARLGKGFHLIHAGNLQIHPDAVFGERCGVMHNVSIGNNLTRPGVPVLGDDVFVGAGACIFGPVRIGDRAIIAANSLVVEDVPADAVAIGVPAKVRPQLGRLLRPVRKQQQNIDTHVRDGSNNSGSADVESCVNETVTESR